MMTSFDSVRDVIGEHPDLCSFRGPRPEVLVRKAETTLGVQFSPSYRAFVLEFGAGAFGSFEVYGVTSDNFERGTVPNGVWATLHYRREASLPASFVVLGDDGMGCIYCLDCSRTDERGESPVVIYDPGQAASEQTPEKVAADFPAYFLMRSERTLRAAGE